jgi:hypothetical protein
MKPATAKRRAASPAPEPAVAAKGTPAVQTATKPAQAVAIATKAQPSQPGQAVAVAPATPPDIRTFNSYVYSSLLTTIAMEENPTPEAKARAHKAVAIALAGFKPTDAVETMISATATALHFAAMESLNRAANTQMFPHAMTLHKDAANLARAMVDMCEALARRRGHGSQQKVIVEHVHVHSGGQAVVGSVQSGAAGGGGPRTGN